MLRIFAAFAALLLGVTADAQPQPQGGSAPASAMTHVQAGRLLADPATGRTETNKTIIVEDGKAGFSPLDAIRTATTWSARHLQLSNEIGSLAPGKDADIITVRGDALADISELQRVRFVMRAGTVYAQR